MSTKYIKDKDNNIIVFSEFMSHSDFKHWKPISAGFISFGVDHLHNKSCSCYGESTSLELKSDPHDTALAMRQILGYDLYDLKENME